MNNQDSDSSILPCANGVDFEGECTSSDRQVIRSELQGNILEINDNQTVSATRPPNFVAEPKVSQRASRAIETGRGLHSVLGLFKFDYFEGLLSTESGSDECRAGGRVEKDVIQRGCSILLEGGLRQGFSCKAGRGYGRAINWHQGEETAVVAFLQVGSIAGKTPQLTVKGGHGFAAGFVPILQKADPNFRIIRVDTCLDLIGDYDADFDSLLAMSSRFATGHRLAAPEVLGTPEDGRTFYLQGKGGVRLRVYEKGLEQRGKGNADAPENWLRIEFEYTKIEGPKKLSVARLPPSELVRHKDFSRQWLERAAQELGLAERGERAARFVAEYQPKVKTLDDTMRHGARQYGRTYTTAAIREIIKADFGGDRAAAVEAGALGVEQIMGRVGAMFGAKVVERGTVDAVLEETRHDVMETPDEWAEATATRLQTEVVRDLERDLRARTQLDAAARPVTQELVNRAELQASVGQAEATLDAVRAAERGDETPLPAPARVQGRMVSEKPVVARWDYHAQQRGEKLFRALTALGVSSSLLVEGLEFRPAWLPGGLSVGEAVMDHRLEPLLHTYLPNLVQRLTARVSAA